MAPTYLRVSTEDVDGGAASLVKPAGSGESPATAPHWATTTLRVEGMTCGACTAAIESAFKGMDGVGTVSVSLVMGRAVVVHDPSRVTAEQVRDAIEDRGFDAEVLSSDLPPSRHHQAAAESARGPAMATTTLAVEGMTCGACTAAIEGAFKDAAGVLKFSVSLLSERAVVEHEPSILSPERIVDMIEDRGFGASVLDTKLAEPGVPDPRNGSGAALQRTTVAIEGMTCGACTSAVEKGFRGLEGLVQFNVSLLAERAVVLHDQGRLSADTIVTM